MGKAKKGEAKPKGDPWFVYAPEGAEPRRWRYAPEKLLSVEAEEIERRSGMPFGLWMTTMPMGSMVALRAFVYVMLRRETPGIDFESVQFAFDDVDFEEADEAAETDPKATVPAGPGTGR